jgi:hypothetical protein
VAAQEDLAGAERWVRESYAIGDATISVRQEGDHKFMIWQPANGQYSLGFTADGQPEHRGGIGWFRGQVKLADALRCYGQPDLYRAYHMFTPDGPPYTYLEAVYPARGVLLHVLVTRSVEAFTGSDSVTGVSYVGPGPKPDLITRFWEVHPGEPYYEQISRSLAPWPGDIRELHITEKK